MFKLLYVPISDKDTALVLASALIEQKLAACINIIPQVISVYKWEGEICNENEVIMVVKTIDKVMSNCVEYIESHHPYEVPCIAKINVESINEKYATWLLESLK